MTLTESVMKAVAMQRAWLELARAEMEPDAPEPSGCSDAFRDWALARIGPRPMPRIVAAPRLSLADRLAVKRAMGLMP